MTGLTAVSLFAGIGGFDLALERSGVNVVAAVEIDDAARGVLADQFPDTTLFTDVREVTGDDLRAAGFVPERGIVTAGFPCQDLSVAGHRRGLGEGTRSGLFWEIARLVADLRPAWLVLENVPGLLSATCPCPGTGDHSDCAEPHQLTGGACEGGCFPSHGGAMGLVLGALGDLGYGFAYRVLDAQHFGVPQRRRRVFIVGRAGGDTRGPVEVLLEPEGRAGHPPARGEARPVVAALTANGVGGGGGPDDNAAQAGHLIAGTLRSHPRPGSNSNGALVASAIGARGDRVDSDATTTLITATVSAKWAKGTGGPSGDEAQNLVPVAFDAAQITSAENRSNPKPGDPAPTLSATGYPHVAHTLTGEGHDASEDGTGRGTPIVPMAFNPKTGGDMRLGYGEKPTALSCTVETAVQLATAVRRLTPLECERLQGFPDGWTATSNGKPQADAPRYRQCGNAIAVPVGEWVVRGVVQVASRNQADRGAQEAAA
jgi:DNA (cytosine-5)-methyltransferase 1